jgi:hypothetical protein
MVSRICMPELDAGAPEREGLARASSLTHWAGDAAGAVKVEEARVALQAPVARLPVDLRPRRAQLQQQDIVSPTSIYSRGSLALKCVSEMSTDVGAWRLSTLGFARLDVT